MLNFFFLRLLSKVGIKTSHNISRHKQLILLGRVNCIWIGKTMLNDWTLRHIHILPEVVAVVGHLLIGSLYLLIMGLGISVSTLTAALICCAIVLTVFYIILDLWQYVVSILRNILSLAGHLLR